MKLRDLEKKIVDHEIKEGATLAEASWTGANAILAILDGELDPETAIGYGLTRNEYQLIWESRRKKEGKTMTKYKGYTIEKITRKDWMIKNGNGETIWTEDDRPTTRTLKGAKELIDRKELGALNRTR